jgi:hypothetical protein
LDALNVNIVNNTIMSNDTTASSGVLFNTFGAPLASTHGPTCTANCGTTSAPQPAGLVSVQNSAVLDANLPATINCPTGHGHEANNACRKFSYPLLSNDIFWQNRSFYIGVGGLSAQFQQNVVALYNAFTTTAAPSQPQADAVTANGSGSVVTGGTGACTAASYWDIGVRGDTGPSNHSGSMIGAVAYPLAPTYSVLTDAGDYSAAALHNSGSNPTVLSQYCNGSRVPPELGSMGYQVPPGISDATVPNPIFNLTPAATVDEGNNWVNISWGPLAATNPVTGVTLGNYSLAAGSPAIDYIPPASPAGQVAPPKDFFGNPRPASPGTNIDVGAVEFRGPAASLAAIAPNTGAFGNIVLNNPSLVQGFMYTNTGTTTIVTTTVTLGDTVNYAITFQGCVNNTLNPGQTCNILVVFTPTVLGALNTTLTVNGGPPATVNLTGRGIAPTATLTGNPTAAQAAFGNVLVNGASSDHAFTYRNTGTGTITTTNVTLSDAVNYTLSFNGCNANQMIPNATCAIMVHFNPKSTGSLPATLTVNGPAPASIALTGRGITTVAVSAPVPALTTAAADRTVKTGVVTVSNTGPGVLTLGATPVRLTLQTSAGAFTLVTPLTGACVANAPLAAGTSCTVGVKYTPPAAPASATQTVRFTVTDSGAATATQAQTITGN